VDVERLAVVTRAVERAGGQKDQRTTRAVSAVLSLMKSGKTTHDGEENAVEGLDTIQASLAGGPTNHAINPHINLRNLSAIHTPFGSLIVYPACAA